MPKGKIREDVFNVHIRVHPNELDLLQTFLLTFDVNYGRRVNAANTTLSAYLLQPHKLLETTFGFQNELLLVISNHHTIQPRALQAVEQIYSEQPFRARADPLIFLLISPDRKITTWLDDYIAEHAQFRTPVALYWDDVVKASEDRWFIRNKLSSQLFTRDIFDYQLPLDTDLFFFGRGRVVEELLDSIRKSQNTGLFGLRKTGKTSVLYKVMRACQETNLAAVVYIDCKLPEIRRMKWGQLLDLVTAKLNSALRKPRGAVSGQTEVTRFRNLVVSAGGKRLAIVIDEIEYISPLSPLDPHWRRDYIDFWQTLWSIQSEFRKISIIVAGVNPYMCEIDLIDQVQNPMFGIVKEVMLTGLRKEDCQAMVRRMGRQLGMAFDSLALDYLHKRYGGHPLLTRMACSFTNKSLMQEEAKRPASITSEQLIREENQRESDLQFYCRHVVSELKQFYDVEYRLLEKIAQGQIVDFLEFAAEPEFIKHLKGYGLIEVLKSGKPEFKIPVIKRYIAFEAARQRQSGELRTTIPEGDRSDWLDRRKDGILRDMKQFLRLAQTAGKPAIYGAPYVVEADQFANVNICRSWSDFGAFINAMNQTFVEPIDHIKGKTWFYSDLRTHYPFLFDAFHRIRLLRHNVDHLRLRKDVETTLSNILREDFFGANFTNLREPWFMLQQICLDETFAGIQYEKNSF